MSIDLDAKLIETASKVTVTRNEYGDVVYGTTTSSPCLYRDISTLEGNQQSNQVTIDGLLWFGAAEAVERGDIYYHSAEGYLKIQRVIKAKRLVIDATRQFIKCEVTKQRQVS